MSHTKLSLEITGPTTGYLRVRAPEDRAAGSVRSLPLVDVIGAYEGPYLVLDFDAAGALVGIEIVGEDDDGNGETKPER